jgi:hypothetical protein
MALILAQLRHELGDDAPTDPADLFAKSDPQAIQMASEMALSELPRDWRRALGERGYNYGLGSKAIPQGV